MGGLIWLQLGLLSPQTLVVIISAALYNGQNSPFGALGELPGGRGIGGCLCPFDGRRIGHVTLYSRPPCCHRR